MVKINLPKEILQKETFKSLPAKEKDEYVGNVLKKIIELNPDGITITQIKEATGLTYSTIWHHLEILSCTAQADKVSKGNLDVYYPCGKFSHLNEYTKNKAKYLISTVENNEGKFICIHEQRENRLGNHIVSKGISIPVELIDNLTEDLNKVKYPHLNEKSESS